MEHSATWSDIVAMKGAREVLKGVKYPDDATRRSLYASWLRVFASNEWDDSFDGLMLDCVAATPSMSTPGRPLFADIYNALDPVVDRPYASVPMPILNVNKTPTLFARLPEPIEPLPARPGMVNYLAELIRKSRTSREALDEAGHNIGFCSLAMAAVVAKPVKDVQDFLLINMESAWSAVVRNYYDGGDSYWPSGKFLCHLARKAQSLSGVVKPYLVLLVLGQHLYHVHSEDTASRDDVMFLEKGFLDQAMFGDLEVVELLYCVQEKTGLSAALVNQILRENGSAQSVAESSRHVAQFLKVAEQPMQKTTLWCRTADTSFFSNLDVCDNLDYALRLAAVLAPDFKDELWYLPEFADASESQMEDARLWAAEFKQALCTGKYRDLPVSDVTEANG